MSNDQTMARNWCIWALRELADGWTYKRIGETFDLSAEGVRCIINRMDKLAAGFTMLPRRDGVKPWLTASKEMSVEDLEAFIEAELAR